MTARPARLTVPGVGPTLGPERGHPTEYGMVRRRRWLAASFLGLGLAVALAELVVPLVIRSAYRGDSVPAINRIISGRDRHSADYYVAAWRRIERPTFACLAALWMLAAIVSHPAVAPRLAHALRLDRHGPLPEALAPRPPPRSHRRLVSALAFGITAGSLAELALDPPYKREHWPFSQYQMYSLLPGTTLSPRRVFGIEAASGREIPLWGGDFLRPFDHSRMWFSWDRLDASPERERLLSIALRDCLQRYEARRARGEHEGPRLSGLRLYRVSYELPRTPGPSGRETGRELLWEVRAWTP